jgi:hypothetical protein
MGPAGEEKVCKESNGASGIAVLKLFREKRDVDAAREMKFAVFCGSS